MEWIRNRLMSFGLKTACIENGTAWTYNDLLEKAESAKAALGSARIVPIETNSTIEGLAQLIGIAATKQIALPLPPELPEREGSRMRQIARASPLYEKLNSSGLVLFSSGTSGEPKGMLHSLPDLLERYQQVTLRDDCTLQLLPIDHIGGLDAALRCLCAGSTLIIPEAQTPDAAAQAIEKYNVNILPASPTFLNLMLIKGLTQKYDCSSVEIVAYGAEPMPQPLLQRLAEAFPLADLQQKFGTSETGAIRIQSSSRCSLFFRIKDPDTEWKVIDGELWLKTPSRIIGYLNADENSLEADGWYRTGDLVEESGDGSLRIIGRQSAVINVGGQKVHPAEVEAILNEIEGIDACRVFGTPEPITGQRVACEILCSTNQDPREWKRRIRNHCRGKIAPWKIPTSVKLADSLKMSPRLKRTYPSS